MEYAVSIAGGIKMHLCPILAIVFPIGPVFSTLYHFIVLFKCVTNLLEKSTFVVSMRSIPQSIPTLEFSATSY